MDEIIGQGYNGSITLTDTGVNIKPGVMGAMFKGGSIFSEKFIPFNSISGVELKRVFQLLEKEESKLIPEERYLLLRKVRIWGRR